MVYKVFRTKPDGTRLAVIEVEDRAALKMLNMCKIRIGFSIAKIRMLPIVIRCFKCHAFGYISYRCPNKDDKECCRKCGEMGHSMKECTEMADCLLCRQKKSPNSYEEPCGRFCAVSTV